MSKFYTPTNSEQKFNKTDQFNKNLIIWDCLDWEPAVSCASVLKSRTYHPEYLQSPIEQKPTSISLIIYKHYTQTKLRDLARSRSERKLSNPWGSKRKSWTLLPFSFHLIKTKKRKRKLWTRLACSFRSATPGTKRKTHLL